jgi:hypothetical protein
VRASREGGLLKFHEWFKSRDAGLVGRYKENALDWMKKAQSAEDSLHNSRNDAYVARLGNAALEREAEGLRLRIKELEIEREIIMRCITGTGVDIVTQMQRILDEGKRNQQITRDGVGERE